MTQTQAVEEIIRRLGGLATLKQIYTHISEIDDCQWTTKTPEASIRRIVQLDKNIVRLGQGIWCLKEYTSKFAKEQMDDHVSIEQLIKRLISIPSSEKRYDMYVNLNTMLQGTSWDLYSDEIFQLLQKNEKSSTIININASIGEVIAQLANQPFHIGKEDKNAQPTIPEELDKPEVKRMLDKSREAGWLDKNYQPIISRTQAAMLANQIGTLCNIQPRWRPFEKLWHREHLCKDYDKAQNQISTGEIERNMKHQLQDEATIL